MLYSGCSKFEKSTDGVKLFTHDGVDIDDDELLAEPEIIGDILKLGVTFGKVPRNEELVSPCSSKSTSSGISNESIGMGKLLPFIFQVIMFVSSVVQSLFFFQLKMSWR